MGLSKIKRLVKEWVPPAVISLYRGCRKGRVSYAGNYASWQEALADSTGYDSDLILEKVASALLKVRSGEAAYERDSVVFDRIQHPFPLLAGLLLVASTNGGKLTVLDFGGSLGSTYFQCRDFLSALPQLTWCIVEQEQFVKRGREVFETENLRFYYSIEECMKEMQPHVALFSGVLQYIENPIDIISAVTEVGVPYLIIDRTPFSDLDHDWLSVQHVPREIYHASYPCRIFSEVNFRKKLFENYRLIADFDGRDGAAHVGSLVFNYKGLICKRL